MYDLSPLFRLERGPDASIETRSGAGAHRQRISISDPKLTSLLLKIKGPDSKHRLSELISERLGTTTEQALNIVDMLLDAKILIPSDDASSLWEQTKSWERWGWRDAFDFHFASRGLEFSNLSLDEFNEVAEIYSADTSFTGPQPAMYKDTSEQACYKFDAVATEMPFRSLGDALLTNWPLDGYKEQGIDIADVGCVLSTVFGTQRELSNALGPHVLRSYPSGGSRHPLEVYLLANAVEGVDRGVYRYDPMSNGLVRIANTLSDDQIQKICFGKKGITTASAVLLMSVRWLRHSWKYRYARSYRMILIEVGHATQALCLAGRLRDLSVYATHAVHDEIAADILNLDDDGAETVVMAFGLGKGAYR